MKLLEKTRKINKLLQKGDKVEFNAIAKLLRDVIEANTYIVGRKGGVKGYALIHEFECDIMREQVLDDMRFPEDYLGFIMSVKETLANIPHQNQNCSFVADTKCIFNGKMTTVVPIYGNGERLGTLIVAKYMRNSMMMTCCWLNMLLLFWVLKFCMIVKQLFPKKSARRLLYRLLSPPCHIPSWKLL